MEKSSSTIIKWVSKKSREISNFEKVFHIFASLIIFWIGAWKIQNDIAHVLSKSSYNSDIWVEIIESLDIFVFISMVMIVNLENIVKHKNQCIEIENYDVLQNIEVHRVLIPSSVLLYGCLSFIIVSQHLFANNQKDFVQFFLSLSTQYYLLYTELNFMKVVMEIKIFFRHINYLLEESLKQPKPVWWIASQRTSMLSTYFTKYISKLLIFRCNR